MESFRRLLDSTNGLDWNFPDPGDRELDPVRVTDYLNRIPDTSDRLIAYQLLNSTRYVPFPEFKESLLKSWAKFKDTGIRSFYLLYPEKIGSESWLIQLLWNELRDYNILGIITPGCLLVPMDKDVDILIVDDMIYTGNNVMGHIDTFTYDLASHLKTRQSELPYRITVHCVIPYISRRGKNVVEESISSFGASVKFYTMEVVPSLADLIPDFESRFDYFNTRWGIEGHPCPIYFDHKVANEFGSFPQIYLLGRIPSTRVDEMIGPLVKKVPSRAIIEKLKKVLMLRVRP